MISLGIFSRKKQVPQQEQQPPPTVVVQVQPQPQPPVHVKEHTRRIPFLERPQDAETRQVIRQAKLRKKLERKGLLPGPQTEIEKMARDAQDLSVILEESRKRQKEFDEQ